MSSETTKIVALFEEPLTPEDQAFLDEQAKAIRLLGRRVCADIIEIGQRLIAAKERVGHGRFQNWVGENFKSWSQDTVHRFMQAANVFGYIQIPQFADFQIEVSALYALSAPSVPKPVRAEAVERAQAGEHITHAEARRMIAEAESAAAQRVAAELFTKSAAEIEETRRQAQEQLDRVQTQALAY